MGLFTRDPLSEHRDEINTYAAEYDALLAADAKRLARFKEYREEATATRGTNLDLDITGEYGRASKGTVKEFQRHRFRLPFGQALTVKHAYRISGRMPDAVVDRREETPQERHRSDTMEKIWWGVTRQSKGDVQFSSAAWHGSQVGAGCFEVYYSPERKMPIYRSVDPAGVLVVKGLIDPHDFQRVYRSWTAPIATVKAEYRNATFRGELVDLSTLQANPGTSEVTLVQVSDKVRTLRFVCGNKVRGLSTITHQPVLEIVHNYGFAPYVVIPNLGPEEDVWGWADYEFIREIAPYLSTALGREADILKMTSNGAYTSKLTGHSTEQIRRILADGGIIGLKKEGEIKAIEPPQMSAFSSNHFDMALKFFEMLGFAPGAAWGDTGAQSGTDRGLQLGPLLELTGLKQTNWGSGLSRLGAMIYKMFEGKQAENVRLTGVSTSGVKRTPFSITVGPDAAPLEQENEGEIVELPMTLDALFDGEHAVRFNWQARLDADDPAYVASEINKFAQGVQSLRTTLERLGCEAPEDEMKLMEQEVQDHPWIRDGMIKLLQMQMNASSQGQGGGAPFDPAAGNSGAVDTMTGPGGQGGALNADATTAAFGGTGQLYGGA